MFLVQSNPKDFLESGAMNKATILKVNYRPQASHLGVVLLKSLESVQFGSQTVRCDCLGNNRNQLGELQNPHGQPTAIYSV